MPQSLGWPLSAESIEPILSLAVWLAGFGHFCVLGASFQVPARLGWRYDLLKLAPFNRKLMWTYAGFTLLTIVAFGTLTLALHEELVRGDRAALAMAAFIGLYWTVRVLVDFLFFTHGDWPAGRALAVGHFLLTSLFVLLAGTYIGLVIWHVSATGV